MQNFRKKTLFLWCGFYQRELVFNQHSGGWERSTVTPIPFF